MPAAVVVEDVSRTFGEVIAVNRVNLTVERGEFMTLLGPSGCGKTTTLRMVAGLEQNTTGRISIGGRVVSDADAGFFVPPDHRQLGMVFQSYAIWPHMTVFDNVAYPLRIRRKSKAEIKQRVEAVLKLVEMEKFAERPAPALSGGQQQRVAIARALVFEPEVLLLDEPLSNLDARLRTQMGDEFRALQKRLGITSLYVTHDQEEAMALSDRVVVMQGGHILQIGSPEEIYQRPVSRAVAAFFGSPNLLEATVTTCEPETGGKFQVGVSGQGWQGRAHSGAKLEPGEKVVVLVRPENVRMANGSANGADMTWSGKVVQAIFRGPRTSITVETGGPRLNVEAAALSGMRVGDEVKLTVPQAGAWAIKPDARN
ncbi:MAG TPA: ABC transporter ATP-binding protein [Xanthobacteraceae bacterium]|nr:ABC transporter ATP-binding protein [Xanthobacteraceae bacterium]